MSLQRASKPKPIGYWKDGIFSSLPDPRQLVGEFRSPADRACVILYLKHGGRVHERWMGWSNCRFCGKHNGTTCISDGVYVWPEGLFHYIEDHGVVLPQEFVEHAIRGLQADPEMVKRSRE